MAIEIKVPNIGTDEVEVIEVLVNVGDKINVEQSLITVEGNKASMEIPSPIAGIVKELKISVGDKVTTGKIIMIFEKENNNNLSKNLSDLQQIKSISTNNLVTNTGSNISNKENIISGIDKQYIKKVNELPTDIDSEVKDEKSILNLESVKVTTNTSVESLRNSEDININNIYDKNNTNSEIEENSIKLSQKKDKVELTKDDTYVHSTPSIRRLAREFGVNLIKIKGSGRKNRILREDVYAYIKEAVKSFESSSIYLRSNMISNLLPCPSVDFNKFGTTKEIKLSKIQKISGANLHRNWMAMPHVTQFDEADITEVENFRKQQNAEFNKKKLDIKITLLVFIMKAVAKGLEELPRFNSSLSKDAQKLILKKYINIGIAVDTPSGLLVPVIRDVNKKGIITLSQELIEISKKARIGNLKLQDMQGGCFTISSLGNIGGTSFTPIINAPEVAILGVSKSSMKLIWNSKEFIPRLMLPISLSYDHRVIDGADGARFICFINEIMSDIRRLIM